MSFGGYEDPLADVLSSRTGFWGGSQMPVQRSDLNFAEGGLGGPFGSPLAPMVVQPLVNAFFGHSGMMPAQFAPMQGLHDQMRVKAIFAARNAAMATASQADRETYVRMLRGYAQMRGTPWGLEQQRGANIMAGDLAYMAPFMAQGMPELFDTMHGTRGSATVMASFLHRGGIMGMDPVTGRTGISGDSAGVLAAEMHSRFFGANVDLSGWRGISAGRAGAMYDELQTRGVMGMSIGAMTRAEQTNALLSSPTSRQEALRLFQVQNPAAFGGLIAETGAKDIAGMAAIPGIASSVIKDLNTDNMGTLLRQFDANKIGNTLKNMSGAVAAMREIFGDLGRPDAPMTQLIEGLNKLTQGGLATMNPAELERSVRTTQVIARTSGMGMTALTGLMAQTVAAAGDLGLDPRFGISAAHRAGEFGIAYGQVGQGNIAAWGRVDADKLKMMHAQLQLNAAASPMANRLGAAMRLYESQVAAGVDLKGTPLAALAEAIQRPGATGFMLNGQMQSFNFSDTTFHQIAAGSRITEGVADAILRSPVASQQVIDKYSIGNIAARAQPEELARILLTQGPHELVVTQLAGKTSDERTTQIAQIAAAAQSHALLTMGPELRKDNATRDKYLMDVTRKAIQGQTGMSDAEFSRLFPKGQFAAMISGGVGRIEEQMRQNAAFAGYPTLNALLDVQSSTVNAQQEIVAQDRAADVAMGTSLAGLSTAPFLANIMNEIQNPSKNLGTAIQKILGGQEVSKIYERMAQIKPNDIKGMESVSARDRLSVAMEAVVAAAQEYDTIGGSNATPAAKEARRKELIAQQQAMRAGSAQTVPMLKETLIQAGLITRSDSNSQAEVNRVAQEVIDGKKGTVEVRRVVAGLAATGGLADRADIIRQQTELIKKAGFTSDADIQKGLRGELNDKLQAGDLETFNKLGGLIGGVDVQAAAIGSFTGGKIGAKEMGDTVAQQALLAAEIAKGLPTTEGGKKEAIARRKQLGETVLETERSIDALLGSPDSMKNLGPGGFGVAEGAHKKMQLRSLIAANAGLNLLTVVSGNINKADLSPRQQEAVDKINALSGQINSASEDLHKRLGEKHGPISPDEWKKYDEYAKNAARTDEVRNREIAVSVSKDLKLSPEEQKQIEQELAKKEGPEGDVRRYALGMSMDARRSLKEMADKRKISIAELRKRTEEGPGRMGALTAGGITQEEITKAGGLFTEAGLAADSETVGGVLRSIHASDTARGIAAEETSKKASGAGKPDSVIVSNTVNVNVVSTGAPAGPPAPAGMNSAP